MIGADDVAKARKSLGRQLAARRRAAGLSQEGFAPQTGYGRSIVANVETGRQNAPRFFWERCDEVLGADGVLVEGHEELELLLLQREKESADLASSDRRDRARRRDYEERPALCSDGGDSTDTRVLDSPRAIERRRRSIATSNVDEAKLRYLERAAVRAIAENERQPPRVLAPQVREMRWHVEQLLQGRQRPNRRERLYIVAAQLSGLLGALALDLGQRPAARAYGQEAFELATDVNHTEMQAWARATQSLIEYYSENYHDALAYAQDGQILGAGSEQSVRLALNGEARALARLGDERGVDEAVDRGLTMLENMPAAPGVSASLSLSAYCPARAAANAATAYLVVGRASKAYEYGELALSAFDSAGLRGPQALTRLDLASALLTPNNVDIDRACSLVVDAMAVARTEQFGSVAQRAREFVVSAAPWSEEPGIRDVAEVVRAHTEQVALEG